LSELAENVFKELSQISNLISPVTLIKPQALPRALTASCLLAACCTENLDSL